jgi:hypothetical protein
MIDPYSAQALKKYLEKKINDTKDYICYSVDKLEDLQYAKGKLSAFEALLQDVKDDLQTEETDGTINQA